MQSIMSGDYCIHFFMGEVFGNFCIYSIPWPTIIHYSIIHNVL